MSKQYYIIGVFLFLLGGCQRDSETIIPQEKLIKILADIHLSEAAAQTLSNKQKDSTLTKYYQQIMEIHQVSLTDFDSTMVVLQEHPKIMLKIYEKVMEEIDKEKAAIK